ITNRGSHLRGELKTKMKELVDIIYGFKSGQNKKTITYNRQLAESLKENLTFTFKNPEARTGIYKTPLIQRAVNAMWFANRRDEGPSFPEFFNPITKPGVAIVLTVVCPCLLSSIARLTFLAKAENSIDERLTGIRTDIPFTTNDYRSVYDSTSRPSRSSRSRLTRTKFWKISASACTILAGASSRRSHIHLLTTFQLPLRGPTHHRCQEIGS
ncbi:hypothetical protein B0H10DRAFT_1782301, partial [Mycena sp. CBHHK59/15]